MRAVTSDGNAEQRDTGHRLGRGFSLLIGGARSGKSDLVVRLGEAWKGPVVFLATAEVGGVHEDSDMEERVRRHQADRPSEWDLIEDPLLAPATIVSLTDDALVIIDCITLWASNMLFGGSAAELADSTSIEDRVAEAADSLGSMLAGRSAPTLVVSNEVGLGVHPETELGRTYRDILGRANRRLADHAEQTFFVSAGRVVKLENLELTW